MPADAATLARAPGPAADPAHPVDPLRPHRFTWQEVLRLSEAGVFAETTRVELIGGEIFTMPQEGFLHVDCVHVLQSWLFANVSPLGLAVCIRAPVYLPDGSVFVPDLAVFPGGTDARGMLAARAELIAEVADATEARDRALKLPRYAEAGAKEVWLVHAPARAVTTHRAPLQGAWTFVDRVAAGRQLSPLCAPDAGFDPANLPEPASDEIRP